MAMFGRSQRSFKPSVYNPGKRTRRMPRWLVLLCFGVFLGAGGVLFLQANYGPQRLTVEESETLHSDLNRANTDRQQLQGALAEAERQRDAAVANREQAQASLAAYRKSMETIDRDMALFQAAIPPDPRGGPIGVRAADWDRQANSLGYKILIMNDNTNAPTFKGTVQLVVQGRYNNGRTNTLTSEPVPFSLDRYVQVAGNYETPAGFTARQVTIRVLDGEQRQHAIRIYNIR